MTPDELIESLTLVDENVRNEAVRQPILFIEAARYRVLCMRRRARAENEAELFSSQLGLRIRARGAGGDRITNDYIKARVQKNTKFIELQSALNKATANEEFSKLLLEAFRMRRDAIRVIADAQGYEAAKLDYEAERVDQTRRLSIEARKLQAKRPKHGFR